MPSDFAFRLSTHLALALACLCLGYAEWDLLKEGSILAGVVVALLAVSFWAEGRYVLDLGAANRVGFAIGVVAIVWLGYQFLNRSSLIYTFPWPASLLPYLGPVLMVLMPAKLFRPKHVGDWWAMQGIALAGAGLAASMADDELFGVLLGLYIVAAVASLSLFFLRRTLGEIAPLPETEAPPKPALYADPRVGSRRLIRRAVGWLVVAAAIAFPFFLVTPRSGAPRWTFGSGRYEVGFGAEEMIDLNRTGELRANRDVALIVTARHPNGRPKDDLNPATRWRGPSFTRYENGQWTRSTAVALLGFQGRTAAPPDFPADGAFQYGEPNSQPDLGADHLVLSYAPQLSLADTVLADPVRWVPGQPGPARNEFGDTKPWNQRSDGSFSGRPQAGGIKYKYRQLYLPPADPNDDRGTPFRIQMANAEGLSYYRAVPDSLRQLTRWANELLVRLNGTGRLPPSVMERYDRDQRRVHPADYEVVAQAFGFHFRTSDEYEYTLKLKKTDKGADPVEDFLFKTKAGHCQRFAAALTLCLRAVGVPAQYVLGFKGCESDGNGEYLIRQDNAHAWVEVLVPHPPSVKPDGTVERWQWLAIDPTPDGSGDGESSSWFGTARETGAALFFDFIIGYNAERRRRAVEAVERWTRDNGWMVAGGLGLMILFAGGRLVLQDNRAASAGLARPTAAGWLSRLFGRRTPAPQAAGAGRVAWYDDLLDLLARHGHSVPAGFTPREFAAAVTKELAGRERTAAVAELPARVTAMFYRTRYAGERPDAAELARIAADLKALAAGLAR
jgi:transglutaminase-like putative cysteine protease